MDSSEDKAALRTRLRAARAGIVDAERNDLSRAASLHALQLPRVATARHVLGFAAAAEELDPAPLLEALRERGALVTLPRIASPGELTLHLHHGHLELETGPFGISQPTREHPYTDVEEIDLVLVPGIAFDARGSRVGFGGGYYDRLLGRLPHAFRLALAYDEQLVDSIPAEEHDEPVDAIVTPRRTLRVETR